MRTINFIFLALVAFNIIYLITHWQNEVDFMGYAISPWLYLTLMIAFIAVIVFNLKRNKR